MSRSLPTPTQPLALQTRIEERTLREHQDKALAQASKQRPIRDRTPAQTSSQGQEQCRSRTREGEQGQGKAWTLTTG